MREEGEWVVGGGDIGVWKGRPGDGLRGWGVDECLAPRWVEIRMFCRSRHGIMVKRMRNAVDGLEVDDFDGGMV
jgi:hypothetical protein